MSVALETVALTKRYRRTWALRDCALTLPTGRVAALVGPNGAGKSTLLNLAVGLARPTAGEALVFGHSPLKEPRAVLPRIGFVAQDHPLYRGFTVAELLTMGRKLNTQWDQQAALDRLSALDIPLNKRAGALSGGQQAQVALTLALSKRPELLLLDEPLASLDPLARRDFLRVLLASATDTGLTVMLSSHIITELERACDYLILLAGGQVRLAGEIDDVLRTHKRLIGPRTDAVSIASLHNVIEVSHSERQTTLLTRLNGHVFDAGWTPQDVSLEDIVLAYLGQSRQRSSTATSSADPVLASREDAR